MRSVIWDMGGTLFDTYPDVDRALALAVHGEATPEGMREVAELTRRSSGEAVRVLAERHGLAEEVLQSAYDGVSTAWEQAPAPVMAGAREVMDAVRAGGGLNLVATHRDRSSAQQLIDAAGLAVDDLVCAPDGHARKPDPAMIRVLLARHGLGAADVVAVGDRPVDVEAARAAGIPGVLLETPGIPLEAGDAPRITTLGALRPMLEA